MSNKQQFVLVRSLSFALGVLGALVSSLAFASIGQFIYVIGDVRVVETSGASRAAVRGMDVNEGDAVITAPGSQAQLRMSDKGFIAVRPDTQMKFDQYKFSGKVDGSENVLLSIIKGGFRSITGLIGSRDRTKYAIRTPAATIGIRGTDMETIVVPEPSTKLGGLPMRMLLAANTSAPVRDFDPSGLQGLGLLAQAGGINPGTFAFVNVGAIRMENKFGIHDVGAKQAGFAPPTAAPVAISVQLFQRVAQQLAQTPAVKPPAAKPGAVKPAAKPAAEKPAAVKPGAAAPGGKPAAAAPAGVGGDAGAGAAAPAQDDVRSVAVVDNTAQLSAVGTGTQTGGAAPAAGSPAATTAAPSGAEVPGGVVTISATAPSVSGGLATLNVSTQEVTDRNLVLDLEANTITNTITRQTTTAPAVVTSNGLVALQPFDTLAAQAAADALAAYNAALAAASAAQTASTAAGTANTTAAGLATVDTTPATSAINTASPLIASASTAVTAANALSLTTVKSTTDANATTATATQSTAAGQVTAATAANAANGSFADAQAGPALTAMTSAKGALDSAVGSVGVAKSTVDTQVALLASAQSAATAALGSANAQLTSAQGSLSTANTANSQITTQQTTAATAASTASNQNTLAQQAAGSGTTALDPSPTTANSSYASGCGAAKACADLAAQYATVAAARQAANDSAGAENAYKNAVVAASKAATFQAAATNAKAAAQSAQTSVQNALTTAQTAVTTATNAVNAAASAAGTGATGAQTQAQTASTQAAAAQSANTTAAAVPAGSNTDLAAAQAAAATVAQQAAIAQYNNPVYDTAKANQFGSNVLAVNAGQANNQVKADASGNAHNTYVLDGSRSLIEIRNSASTPAVGGGTAVTASGAGSSASTPSDAGIIFNANGAGVAADNSGTTLVDTTRGSIYFGRWQGGTINVTGASPFTIDLGTGTGARSAHWLVGYQPTTSFVQSRMGTATYTLAGGTRPTDAAGIVGTLSSATLTANFDALPQLVAVNLGITFPSRTFSVAASNVPISGNGFTSTTTPTCTGCSGAWSAVLAGNFMRTDITALGLTYALTQAPASTPNAYADQVQGVAVLTTSTAPAEAPTLGAALAAKASAQAAYDAAVIAANAAQTASTAANTANTTAQGLLPVDTTPATSAIGAATPLVSSASTEVTAANALSLTAVKSTTDANAATAASAQSTAASQVTSATSVNTANGAFADTLAGPALTAMTSAKGTLDSAVSSVSSAKDTVDTQVAALASAQPAATTALANANTQLTNAQGSLTTANNANSEIPTQQTTATTAASTASTQLGLAQAAVGSGTTSLDPSPTTANSSIASGCATALACSDLASQYATATSTALGAGDVPGAVNAKNNAVTAAQRADSFKTAATNAQVAAQSAQTIAQNALTAAQAAVTNATNAVNAGATAGTSAQSEASTATTQAAAAQTAVASATAAQTASNSGLTSAQTAALTVAQQAVIAQYNNPALATANGFGHIVASSEPVAAGSNRKADGAGLSNANTTYVLDGQKNLVEMRQTTYKSGAFSATPTKDLASADIKFANGTAADTFNQPGEVYLGRWQGGDVQVDDLSNGAGTDFTINLGSGASAQSAHWMIFRQPATTNYAQTKLTGNASYTLLAATKPTDTSGAAGTGVTASLTANFDAPSVSANVTANFTNKSVVITGLSMPIVGNSFSGTTSSAACTGAGCGGNTTYVGEIIGGFGKVDASAAGFSYGMWAPVSAGSTYTDLIRGVVALSTTDTLALRPQPDMNFATTYHYSGGTSTNSFQAIGNAGYSLDGNGNLTQVADEHGDNTQVLSGGTAVPSTASQTAALADSSKISFGRWSGTTVSGVDYAGAFSNRTVQGSYHWVGGAAQTPFFTSDALNVTAKYTVTGSTEPTDQSNATGTFNSAALTVDFGRQAVNASVNVTTAAGVWSATGTDIALSGGRFWANKGSSAPYSSLAVTLGGSVTGTNGSLSGILMGDRGDGAGMTYALSQGTNTVAGAVALQATAGVQGAGQSVPTANPMYAVGVVAAGNLGTFSATDAEYATTVMGTVNPAPGSRDVNGQVYSFNAEAPAVHAGGVATVPALYELAPNVLGPTPPGPGAAVSPQALTDSGSEATTGITWGRYNGFVFYNDRIAGAVAGSFDVRAGQAGKSGNWHGIWSPDQTGAPVLPLSGTYTQIGGTMATDNKGGASTALPTATLTANFTNMTVDAGVTAVIAGGTSPGTWTGAATNVPIQQRTYFDTNAVSVTAPVAGAATAGKITGVFTGGQSGGPAPGAIMGYSLNAGGAAGTSVSGVAAFKR